MKNPAGYRLRLTIVVKHKKFLGNQRDNKLGRINESTLNKK